MPMTTVIDHTPARTLAQRRRLTAKWPASWPRPPNWMAKNPAGMLAAAIHTPSLVISQIQLLSRPSERSASPTASTPGLAR